VRALSHAATAGVRLKPGRLAARLTSRHFDRPLLQPLDSCACIEVLRFDHDAERLEQGSCGGGFATLRPDAHFLAGKLGEAADLGAHHDVNLLRCEPRHELEVI
jgi:hypothetical protein